MVRKSRRRYSTSKLRLWTLSIGPGDIQHHLVAVNVNNDIIVSDVTLTNTTGGFLEAGTANAGVSVAIHELVDIVGAGSVGNMLPHNIHFV